MKTVSICSINSEVLQEIKYININDFVEILIENIY